MILEQTHVIICNTTANRALLTNDAAINIEFLVRNDHKTKRDYRLFQMF